jgi:1-aminocyclopropane-1-carboxylate deaminase/D-cysteine desulfhydrase-like pyridoxal-dependent ACC family enzyme
MTDALPNATPEDRHILRRFPRLRAALPWMPLAELPSPVGLAEHLSRAAGRSIWIKDDGADSTLYSGNKPRKFEFIFAEAIRLGRTEVMTMGTVGSNHAAATCLFCCRLGLRPVLALAPQPVLSYVRENILVDHGCEPVYLFARNEPEAVVKMAAYFEKRRRETGTPPYFMYFGGSNRLGNVGFVEAGFELAAQIAAGELPKPSRIFVATGSCGTHAGLMVGLRAAGMPEVRVVGVRIVPKIVTNKFVVATHANQTAAFLRRLDPTFPAMHFRARDVDLLDDFVGGGYGVPTPEGKDAINLVRETEGLALDPTYTGKAMAGALATIAKLPSDEPVVFWNTKNNVPLDRFTARTDPNTLPKQLRRYFEKPLYDLDL